MDLFQVDDDGRLFISAAIEDWAAVARHGIDTVIDLEGGLDTCIPTASNGCLYVYFPFDDDNERLPDMTKLRRSEEHTSELQSLTNLVCRLLLEKKKK